MSDTRGSPLLTVVVACFKQADPLDLVLESFLRQDFPKEDYEIVVVDDHSPDHEARCVVATARRNHPTAAIHYLRQYRSDGGQYRASAVVKNAGLRLARGKYVYFNNAEIMQAGQSLTYIASKLESSPVPLCLRGRVMDLPRNLLEGKDQAQLEMLHDATDRSLERVASADHAGLAAAPRTLLLAIGGNDERFDHWGKEDLDLARRLKAAGAVYVYDENLKSFHVNHPPNFQRQGDYRRMASLLQANARDCVVEANIGSLWGQLEPTPSSELDVSVLVEASDDLSSLGLRLEALYYGRYAERIEIAVAAREPLREAVEGFLARRFRGIPLVVLPALPESGSLVRAVYRLRASTVVFSSARCQAWSWNGGAGAHGDAMPLVPPGPTADHTSRAGPRLHVPWAVDRLAALASLADIAGFEDLPLALLNSPDLARWSGAPALSTSGPGPNSSNQAKGRVLALIPYFQCGTWIQRCIASLACQTRPLDGVALLLDGRDSPPDGLLNAFPQVSVYAAEEHVGPYALIQAAMETTEYDWYLFQDADDWSAANRLERLLAMAALHDAELVGSQEIRVFDPDGSAMAVSYPLDANAALLQAPGHALLHPSSLVHRSLVMRVGGFATGLRFSGDTEFVLRAAHRARIVNTSEALYFRRSRAGSLTTAADTGLESPVRKTLLQEMKNRARSNAALVANGLLPKLEPCALRPRVALRHVGGPRLGS